MRKAIKRSHNGQAAPSPAESEAHPSTPSDPGPIGTGIYVDVENLRANGQQIVRVLLDTWPEAVPPPKRLLLYVRADLVELWRLWASNQFRSIDITVKGVQHFSTHSSKNSADIAIATDAMSDLLLGEVDYLAVVSDDSDFIALYAAVRDRMARTRPDLQRVPFMWVITDRNDTLSTTVRQYFPREAIYVVPFEETTGSGAVASSVRAGGPPSRSGFRPGGGVQRAPVVQQPASPPAGMTVPPPVVHDLPLDPFRSENGITADEAPVAAGSAEQITAAIVEQIPVGVFKSTDCQQVIRRRWPDHPLAMASGPAFGTEFLRSIWPLLERRGARVLNPGQSPRRYEMTETAKHQA